MLQYHWKNSCIIHLNFTKKSSKHYLIKKGCICYIFFVNVALPVYVKIDLQEDTYDRQNITSSHHLAGDR